MILDVVLFVCHKIDLRELLTKICGNDFLGGFFVSC